MAGYEASDQSKENAKRACPLTVHSRGVPIEKTKALTGCSKAGFYKLLQKAKERGCVPSGPIKLDFIEDATRTGAPRVSTEAAMAEIEGIVMKNSTTREHSTEMAISVLKDKDPHRKLSRRPVHRALERMDFRRVKPTTKPGLNAA
ncbi:uncharacterized protein BCR38DRAFT_481938 [Pseudomassariella vexata]|uniref:Transposase Tc1-like domain-containing protein n=1 Tax=Pseudomassariella vexata TaxID=1141098 RepID=A0A1Y2EA82_9PEZI|nr:uncharacterized protein BCR38DRAFT_481938 [Pseudomassariella vexata]ORY68452.1 hypothetical protein BCR38DRAFT_481938 [Pseudomassariella vexata]